MLITTPCWASSDSFYRPEAYATAILRSGTFHAFASSRKIRRASSMQDAGIGRRSMPLLLLKKKASSARVYRYFMLKTSPDAPGSDTSSGSTGTDAGLADDDCRRYLISFSSHQE